MLLDCDGKPLIVRSYQNVAKSKSVDGVYVATPDKGIYDVCKKHDIPCLTVTPAKCGSHSVMMAAKQLKKECNLINIQGDWPSVSSGVLNIMSTFMYKTVEMCSAYYICEDRDIIQSTNNVKVVINREGFANYFSRSPIPYAGKSWKIHVGVYGFPYLKWMTLLDRYNSRGLHYDVGYPFENLEQLNWLYEGHTIRMFKTQPCYGIDTVEDYEQYKDYLSRERHKNTGK